MKDKFILILLLTLSISFVQAQQSYLDSSFSGNCSVSGDFNNGYGDVESALAIQKDGKIVAVGYTLYAAPAYYEVIVTRYNANGTTDKKFGTQGKISQGYGFGNDYGNDVKLQPDGKILVAGYTFQPTSNYDFFVSRYNRNGTLDSSFGHNGSVFIDNTLNYEYYPVMALQEDGKIIVTGSTGSASRIAGTFIARLNTNGTLDNSFGTNGTIVQKMGTSSNERGTAVILLPGTKIIVGGYCQDDAFNYQFCLLGYDSTGKPLMNFGINGKVLLLVTGYDLLHAMAVSADNKILAAGEMGSNFGLVKFDDQGRLDNSFGDSGVVITNVGGSHIARAVAVQPNGKITVGGGSFVLARYKPKGVLDKSFGDNGLIKSNFNFNTSMLTMGLQKDGKPVTGGWKYEGANPTDFFTARFLPALQAPISVSKAATILQQKNIPSLSAFPNPATHFVWVKGLSLKHASQITISNYAGIIFRQQFAENNTILKINIADMPAGMYYITVQDNATTRKCLFLKN
ncbi:T9SS type A sorting domain-containing protein [Limnovirga soli]|nr:T9SS type A sorting domain-containing protein [Limnovirga soli]